MTSTKAASIHLGTHSVSTPSGQKWHVGRCWTGRRKPPHWRGKRIGKEGIGEAADTIFTPVLDSPYAIVVYALVVAAIILAVIVVIPLLLFSIELIILGLAVAVGVVGRALLGRPWVVQAMPNDDSTAMLTWQVVGWRRSRRLITEVAVSLETGKALPAHITQK